MTNVQLSVLAVITLAGATTSMIIQHRSQARLRDLADAAHLQEIQLADLAGEHGRMLERLAQAETSAAKSAKDKLQRLRAEAERLRKQTEESEKRRRAERWALPPLRGEQHSKQYWEQLHRMAGGKAKEAMILSAACVDYARDNQHRFPSAIEDLQPYLLREPALSGTNEFELTYQGSIDELDKIPQVEVAVVRDRQAWAAPNGKLARVYGMFGGVGRIVESDDDFQSWEAQHVVPPPVP